MWWKIIGNIIRKTESTTYRTKDGKLEVRANTFKGLPLSAQKEINDIVENECLTQIKNNLGKGQTLDSLSDIQRKSAQLGTVINTVNGPATLIERVGDALGYRDFITGRGGTGGISNLSWTTGVSGQDPARDTRVTANIYINPREAANIYSQGGIARIIIEKKAKTLLDNGVHIKNSRLNATQIEAINQDMIKTGLAKAISDSLRDSLTYGGAVLFPFFKLDSPLSMSFNVEQLARTGIIKKNCVDRWCVLDRWNTVHYPNWNPTSQDFLKPKYFYIHFLGCDVHSSRLARIVTAPQPGYWGMMMHMGWGVSDIPSWIEAMYNYYNVLQAIPVMINQMSLLARTFNVDGPLAMEGAMILDQMGDETTMRVRQASMLNPVNLDVVGKLEAIQRDFAQVPELTRLIRQDLAAKAGFLEQTLFTVEKSGLGGSNDKTQNSWGRQEETNKFMYADVQTQLKPTAMLQVINALGVGKDILEALPYTQIVFDEQKVTDIEDRTDVLQSATKGFFDVVAGGMPLADAAIMVEQLSGGLMSIDTDLRKQLKDRQKMIDEREKEKHEMEMLLGKATISSANKKNNEGHSYDDPLEQKKMEKVSGKGLGTKKQGLAKMRNKVVK